MATPFEPLAGIVTPQQLTLSRAADWNNQYLMDRKLAQNGAEGGFASIGTAIGQGLSGLLDNSDPQMVRARQNAAILTQANNDAQGIGDPFLRQIAVLSQASNKFRSIGAFDTSSQLDASVLQLKQQQTEMAQLKAKGNAEQAEADTKNAELPFAAASKIADINNKNAGARNFQSEVENRAFEQNIPKPQVWFDPTNPTPTPIAVNDKDPAAVAAAQAKGWVPLSGGLSVQAKGLGDLGSQPIGSAGASDVNHGLTNQHNINQLRTLAETLQGAVDKDGRINPGAVLQYAGGVIGTNDAANAWNANYNQLRANVQSLIKGTPSNRDAMIFEATIPQFFDPYNVKIAKLDALDAVNKQLVTLTIEEHQATKQALPTEILAQAQQLGIDVGNLPAMTIQQTRDARTRLANAVQAKVAGSWGMAQQDQQTNQAKSERQVLDDVLSGKYKPRAQ